MMDDLSIQNKENKKIERDGFCKVIQLLMQETLARSGSHGVQLYLDSPKLGFKWSGAAGFSAQENGHDRAPILADQPLRIASNTKTFVAAAILRLWEDRRLALDDGIVSYLSLEHASMLRDNGYQLNDISVRHLLSHTSGLFDYGDSSAFAQAISRAPERQWSRTQQLQIAMITGEPYGQPGEVYRYSDTGYILLGEIIEYITGLDLGAALRNLLNYQRLGLHRTWLESIEDAPLDCLPRVHQYEGAIDTYQLHPSCDIYGGGGLLSTVKDMACFMRSLFTGQLYQEPQTLAVMLSTLSGTKSGPPYSGLLQVPATYRLGIVGDKDGRVFQHSGHFGSLCAYIPELDLALGLSINIARQGSGLDFRELFLQQLLHHFHFESVNLMHRRS